MSRCPECDGHGMIGYRRGRPIACGCPAAGGAEDAPHAPIPFPKVSMPTLVLPLPPSANNLYRNVQGKGRVLNKAGREYKQAARMLAMGARFPLLRCDVLLQMVVYFPNRRRRDLSNTLKVIEDSLSGIAYADDSQVARIELTRRYDNANPRAEVRVQPYTEQQKEAA